MIPFIPARPSFGWPYLFGALIYGGIFALISFVIYHQTNRLPPSVPAFADGQMVRMKAFGAIGMVIRSVCWSKGCSYDVRFPSLQVKIPNGGLFSNGGPVDFAPVSSVNVREFEIEAI